MMKAWVESNPQVPVSSFSIERINHRRQTPFTVEGTLGAALFPVEDPSVA
jgi:hypothetical protein